MSKVSNFNEIALKLTYFDDVYFFQQCLSRTGLNHSFVTICIHVVVKSGLFWLHAPLPISTILQEIRCFTVIKKFVLSGVKIKLASELKGALDNLSLIPPIFFQKNEILIPSEVCTYVVTACLILLANSSWLQRYVNISCRDHFKKCTFKKGHHCHDCWIWHHPPLF